MINTTTLSDSFTPASASCSARTRNNAKVIRALLLQFANVIVCDMYMPCPAGLLSRPKDSLEQLHQLVIFYFTRRVATSSHDMVSPCVLISMSEGEPIKNLLKFQESHHFIYCMRFSAHQQLSLAGVKVAYLFCIVQSIRNIMEGWGMPVRACSDNHIPLFCRLVVGIDLLPVHNIPPGRDVGRPQVAVPNDMHTESLSTSGLHGGTCWHT